MRLTDLPPSDDYEAVRKFAATFNGYQHFGSFGACAAAAKAKSRSSLDECRNELFFAYRATNHTGHDSLTPTYVELLPFLRRFIESGS